ncbi:MAG: hypothetical protein QGH33_00915, partial [Pirellulaceae bacterium]|nr:hypothetical protein [Pirellulaceae bacterium]
MTRFRRPHPVDCLITPMHERFSQLVPYALHRPQPLVVQIRHVRRCDGKKIGGYRIHCGKPDAFRMLVGSV